MIISEVWLREWIDPDLDTEGLVECLTMAGLEVDSVSPAGPAVADVVVARIDDVAAHPDADKLRVCRVDAGRHGAFTIVCGAANARRGLRSALALPGARLPGGALIESAAVRGIESQGMLCSPAELGLEDHSEGLFELDDDAPLGASLAGYLRFDDTVIDIDLTPNRGDCLSILGIARELKVLTGSRIKRRDVPGLAHDIPARIDIAVRTPEDCPRYVGRVMRDLDTAARTPIMMRERLRRCGVRPISPIVDVTNYVMLELGQPMHAFDLSRLRDGIIVRRAAVGEALQMLDDSQIQLDERSLVIADADGPLALAGVMGGARSGIGPDTRDIVFEAAHFTTRVVAGKARQYGLQTESSHRFERGVDPELPYAACQYASALLRQIAGGATGPVLECSTRAALPVRRPVDISHRRLCRLLGFDPGRAEVARILKHLARGVHVTRDGWQVMPPSYRFDMQRECDLIEEVARVNGYHRIPAHTPLVPVTTRTRSETELTTDRLRCALVDRDYREVITYSFVDPDVQALIDPQAAQIQLANPIASNLSTMRTSMWPGLLQAVGANLNRQHRRVRVFEIGHTFHADGPASEHTEVNRIGGAVTGLANPEQWGSAKMPVDFFDVKSDVEALLSLTGRRKDFTFTRSNCDALHPGQAADILCQGRAIGRMGRLHPGLEAQLDLTQPICLFELEVDALRRMLVPSYRAVSKFPAIRRDISVLVDETATSGAVEEAIRGSAGEHLVDVKLFDVFRPERTDPGRISLTFNLTIQASSRTLTDVEVNSIVDCVVDALHHRFGAELRS